MERRRQEKRQHPSAELLSSQGSERQRQRRPPAGGSPCKLGARPSLPRLRKRAKARRAPGVRVSRPRRWLERAKKNPNIDL